MADPIKGDSIPLKPESIVEFAWGLSLFFSQDEQEKKYGEDLKNKWDDLAQKYKEDKAASCFLDNVNATMSGTVCSLAQLRQELSDHFGFLDSLQKRRIGDLDDLANLSKDAQSVALRIVGLSMGGGLTFIPFAANVLGARAIAYIVLGAGASYILFEIILRAYRNRNAPRILNYIQEQKDAFLRLFLFKSKEVLSDLLKKVNAISEDLYGANFKIKPGIMESLSLGSAVLHSSVFITGSSSPGIRGTLDVNNKTLQPSKEKTS